MSDAAHPEQYTPGISQLTLRQGEGERLRSRALSEPGVSHDQATARRPELPGYLVTAFLGEGAHAQVWRALQERTRKDVAVKVYLSQRGLNWLFLQREVERLIRLDKHPNITTLFDADLASPTPFYAMELMEHGSLERVLAQGKPLAPARVAEWLRQAAEALDYVHAKGLIHCDLKPANLLLDEQDHVRLADFGQSRILASEPGSLGTLCYMAPEQAVPSSENEPSHPSPRWDIYSLGAVAYALLLNRAPLEKELTARLEGVGRLEDQLKIYRAALESAPPRLQGMKVPGLDKDLAAIVDQCLELDPEKRYQSPALILKDLEARRSQRPVAAMLGKPFYRSSKFLKRNWAYLVLGSLALGLAFAVVAGDLKTRRELMQAALLLRAQNYAASGDFASAAVAFARLNVLAPSAYASASASAFVNRLSSPRLQWARPPVKGLARMDPSGTKVLLARGRILQFFGTQDARPVGGAMRHPQAVLSAAESPDGLWLASSCADGKLRLWDTRHSESPVEDWDWEAAASTPSFSGDGKFLMALVGDRELRILESTSLAIGPVALKSPAGLKQACFSPDGTLVLAVDALGHARLWDRAKGMQLWEAVAHIGGAEACIFSPDGKAFATGGDDRKIRFWSLKRNGKGLEAASLGRRMAMEGKVTGICFSPEGHRLLAWGNDNAARIFSFPSGLALAKPLVHAGWVRSASFNPDGTRVLSAGNDKSLRQWMAKSGEALGQVMEHDSEISWAGYSPDGQTALSLSDDGVARLWELASGPGSRTLAWPGMSQAFLSPDGGKALALAPERGLAAMEFSKGGKAQPLKEPRGRLLGMRFAPQAQALVRLGSTLELKPLEGEASVALASAKLGPDFFGASLDPGGERLMLRYDRSLRVLSLPGLKPLSKALSLPSHPLEAYLIPGREACVLRFKKRLAVMDLKSGKLRDQSLALSGGLRCLAVHPSSRLMATGGEDKCIRFWDLESGEAVGRPIECRGAVAGLQFSQDGRYVLASCPSLGLCQRFSVAWAKGGIDPEDLFLKAQVISRRGLDPQGRARPLGGPEWARLAEAYAMKEP